MLSDPRTDPDAPLSPAPTLTGPDEVVLRAHRASDVAGVLEQSTDPISQQWTTIPVPYTEEHARGFVHGIVPTGWAQDAEWAFAVEVAGRYAGTVSLRSEGGGRAEVAFGSHPWVRGTGAMTTAVRLLVEWGFAERGLETIIWFANRGNWASRRLAWRLGFSFDGTLERWLPQRGELLDAWVGTLHHDDPREPRGPWLQAPVLDEGGPARLRPWRVEDAPRVVEACSEERTAYWLGRLPSPYTPADAAAYVESRFEGLATGTVVSWAVADPADDRLVGSLALFDLRPGIDAEIGYWTHPEARGRGVMTEATRLALQHAFEGLGLSKVRISAAADNLASRHVIEQQGCRFVGMSEAEVVCRDGLHDHVHYEQTASAWRARTGR